MVFRVEPPRQYLPVANTPKIPGISEETFRERMTEEGYLLGTLVRPGSLEWDAFFNPSGQLSEEGEGYNFVLLPKYETVISPEELSRTDTQLLSDCFAQHLRSQLSLISFSFTDPQNFSSPKELPNTLQQLHFHFLEYFHNPFEMGLVPNTRREAIAYGYYSEPYPAELSQLLKTWASHSFPEITFEPSAQVAFAGHNLPNGSIVTQVSTHEALPLIQELTTKYKQLYRNIKDHVGVRGTMGAQDFESLFHANPAQAPNWMKILSQLDPKNTPVRSRLVLYQYPTYSVTLFPGAEGKTNVTFRPHLFNHRGRLLDIGLAVARQRGAGEVTIEKRKHDAEKEFAHLKNHI